MRQLAVIGCGNVGTSVAQAAIASGQLKLGAVLNRSVESSQQAVSLLSQGVAISNIAQLPEFDLLLIGTPDDQISAVAQQLSESNLDLSGKLVFHCSGALSSEILSEVKAQGAIIASAHPLMTFPEPLAAERFTGLPVGIEGEQAAVLDLKALFESIGAEVFEIPAAAKVTYHAAVVMACNYLVVLLDQAANLMSAAGIDQDQALRVLAPIVEQTVKNVLHNGPEVSLTGPIVRGDLQTVQKHLADLQHEDACLLATYRQLAAAAVKLAVRSGRLAPDNGKKILSVVRLYMERATASSA